jgi:hypothetical protein
MQLATQDSLQWWVLVNTEIKKLKLKSVTFSLQANYTDRATAACRRS